MTDAGALREQYRDLIEIDRPPEGIRYSATLPDGTQVVALAIAASVVTDERSAVTAARRGRGCLPGAAVALAVLLGASAAGAITRG